MKFTNRHNVPETIVRAVQKKNAEYDRGPAHRSVTQLITPPRIDVLRKKHFHEMEKDVSEEWWALFGTAVHQILEWGAKPGQVVEERLYTEIDGWVISGMLDCQTIIAEDHCEIMDYKVTAAYSIVKEGGKAKREWEQQLNMQAFLVEQAKGLPVTKLSILAIVRDWQNKSAQTNLDYPQSPIAVYPVDLWSHEDREAYMMERIREHRRAEMNIEIDAALPECSPYERWAKGDKWAVMKGNGKRAVKVFDDEEKAVNLTEIDKSYRVEYRPGEPTRCVGNYCQVAQWCDQWQREKANHE